MPPPTPKDKTTLEIGQLFGHSKQFTITKLLGRGGFGEVYLANELRADRRVAIKVLKPDLGKDDGQLRRFRGEYTLACLVSHPSLVKMIDLAETRDGIHYIAMEYLDGVLLSARMHDAEQKQGHLDLNAVLTLGWQIASLLEQLHARNILHRDLKPGNIMLVPDSEMPGGERVKLLDFGIAKLTDAQRAKTLEVDFQTATSDFLGTPAFMAPENFTKKKGGRPGPEADVYALGCILYRCLAGNYPFEGEGVEIALAHMTQQPIPIKDESPSTPPEVAALIDGMLAKEPAARPTMATIAALFGRRLGATTPAGQVVIRSTTSEIQAVLADISTNSLSIPIDPITPTPAPAASAPVVPIVSGEQPAIQAGQQITTTQTRSSNRRRRLVFGVAGTFVIVLAGSIGGLLWSRQASKPTVNQPLPVLEQSAPVPKASPPTPPAPIPTEAVPPVPTEAPVAQNPPETKPEVKAGKAKCEPVEPTSDCIIGALSAPDRGAFVKALALADIKLCPSDFLAVVGKPQLEVTRSKGVARSKKEELVYSLRGNPTKIAFSGEVIIRCGKGK